MNTRYLKFTELEQIALNGVCPEDCERSLTIAISPISDILIFVEENKRNASTVNETENYILNVQAEVDRGGISISELDADDIGYFLSDDILFDTYLDKETNPYDLTKCISLTVYSDTQWWDENIYSQSV